MLKIALIVLQLCFSIISIVGVISTTQVLGNQNNINIDAQHADFMVYSSNESANFFLPMSVNNEGMYNYSEFTMKITLTMVKKASPDNPLSTYFVLEKTLNPITIKAGQQTTLDFQADPDDFDFSRFDDEEWNLVDSNGYDVYLYMDISAKTNLDFVSFTMAFNYTLPEMS